MPPLNCNEFDSLADELIESRKPLADDRLSAHAAACDRCRARFEEQTLLESVIPAWKSAAESIDVADAVLAKWAFERGSGAPAKESDTARRRRRRFAGFAALVASAAVLIAAVLLSRPMQTPDSPPEDSIAMVIPENPADGAFAGSVGDDDAPRPRGLLREAGSAYLSLAEEAGRAIADAAEFVPQAAGDVDFRPSGQGATTPDQPRRGWSDGFSPIGHDVGKAVDFLLDAFPSDSAPTT